MEHLQHAYVQKALDSISDENLHKLIVANGNSPSRIFGHLVDTDDGLLELFESVAGYTRN